MSVQHTAPASDGRLAPADVVVIGGGIVGAASAFYLAREGLTVTVVERRHALGQLTTLASAASFRAQFTDADNIALMHASIEVFEHFDEVIGRPGYDIGLRQKGYLFVSDRDEDQVTLRDRVSLQRDLGLPDVEYLDREMLRARFPYLAPEVLGAAYRAGDGWIDAQAVTQGFAAASGATVLLNTAATGIDLASGHVRGVRTTVGTIPCGAVVVAAGPFSGSVAQSVRVALPLTLLRRHTLWLAPRHEIPPQAPMTIDAVTGAHWRPRSDGGALVAWSLPADPTEPQDPVPVDASFARSAIDGVARLTPFWRGLRGRLADSELEIRAGQYTVTPDHNPVIGAIDSVPGLFVNTGYSGHGVMASPGGAQILARVVTGRPAGARSPYDPGRFGVAGLPDAGERLIL